MNKLLSSIKYVADNSIHVHINQDPVDRYVESFQPTKIDHWMKACPFDYRQLPKLEDELDRWFLSDAMAFCFWGYPQKWSIDYQGKKIDGWWALLASFQRAIENKIPLFDGNYLSNINFEDAQTVFAGTQDIPLFDERLEAFHNIGRTLVERYNGSFHNYLKVAPRNAVALAEDLARVFPIFDDVSIYKGQPVYFYKKAQLLVHDIVEGFPKSEYAKITNIDDLTGEADYKIPALLRQLGVLSYSQDLANKVDNRVELLADSPEEIEIRAGMLWACHLICQKLKQRGIEIDPITLDGILWVQSQTKSPADKPYHLTLTTDY